MRPGWQQVRSVMSASAACEGQDISGLYRITRIGWKPGGALMAASGIGVAGGRQSLPAAAGGGYRLCVLSPRGLIGASG